MVDVVDVIDVVDDVDRGSGYPREANYGWLCVEIVPKEHSGYGEEYGVWEIVPCPDEAGGPEGPPLRPGLSLSFHSQ